MFAVAIETHFKDYLFIRFFIRFFSSLISLAFYSFGNIDENAVILKLQKGVLFSL